jgi:hypothetical protein
MFRDSARMIGLCLLAAVAAARPAVAAAPDFSREVRPILANRCFKCHGPDEGRREAGLRLDRREDAVRPLDDGRRAIVPGNPETSELVARISSTDPDLVMPPPETKAALAPEERRILAAWVAAGAEYRPHWAFEPPVAAALPAAPGGGPAGHPVDAFVRERLARAGLSPAPEADRATLCRRVHLDLIGLPPSPAALDAFLADTAPGAWERLVDSLLASPRYGERWARRWLDLARYADTNGYEKDRDRSIWPWRDWVIRALDDDMPFDLFTIRQIAGDMLPGGTPDDVLATGFHRNTMINEEGGIDPLEFRYLAMVDRVATTGATWLGLTTGCAQCHTHKFDPLTHTDYFRLMACLDNADEPEWLLAGPDRDRHVAETTRRIEEAWRALPARWPEPGAAAPPPAAATEPLDVRFAAWSRAETERAIDWRVARPTAVRTTMPHLVVRPDGSILASGDATKSEVYTLELGGPAAAVRAIRLEVLPDESLPGHGPGLAWYEGPKGDFFLSEFEVAAGGRRIGIARATESFAGKAFAGGTGTAAATIDGEMSSGWTTNGEQGRPHAAVYVLAEPVPAGTPLVLTLRFERHYACGLGCFRISLADAERAEARGHEAAVEAALAKPAAARSEAEQGAVFRGFLASAPELAAAVKEIRGLEAALRGGTRSLVLRERPADNPRRTFRRHRGEFTQPEEEVAAGVPSFLPPLPAGSPADRLALARWLVSPANPLTSRVVVNRQWQAFFGRGIVATLDDFGTQGDPPSHPELLDWLAVQFMRPVDQGGLGWSLKRLHRLIVTSATYRQDSTASPEAARLDPKNVLVARGPRVRLEAEVIRDSLLEAAGLLSRKTGGPGVRPPQPEGVTEAAYGSPKWTASTGEDRHRRSIYTFQKRTAPFAFTTTFDGPSGEACLARREVSNSPLQALSLLNDPMFLEAARALGAAALAAGPDDRARLDELTRRVLSRRLDDEEAAELLAYLRTQRARLAAGELDPRKLLDSDAPPANAAADAVERAAWMLVARGVMNLDEAISKR